MRPYPGLVLLELMPWGGRTELRSAVGLELQELCTVAVYRPGSRKLCALNSNTSNI